MSTIANQDLTDAFQMRDRATRQTRYLVEYYYYEEVSGELEQAEKTLLEWLHTYPNSDDGLVFRHLSKLHRILGRYESAASEAQEYYRNNPDSVYSYEALLQSYRALGRLDEAKKASEEARTRNVDGPVLRFARYTLAFLQNDNAAMQEQIAWTNRGRTDDLVLWLQSDTEAFFGHFRSSRELSARGRELSKGAGESEMAAIWEGQTAVREAEVGNFLLARQMAAGSLAISKANFVKILAALALARSGDRGHSQELAAEVSRDMPLNTMTQDYWLPSIVAAAKMDTDPLAGIKSLEVARPYEFSNNNFLVAPFGSAYPIYVRGLVYLKAREARQAATEFQKLLDHRGIVGNFIIGALAHLQLARAQAMMGDKEAARQSYQDFLTLWKDADPDIPIYRQAKAEYKKLRATSN